MTSIENPLRPRRSEGGKAAGGCNQKETAPGRRRRNRRHPGGRPEEDKVSDGYINPLVFSPVEIFAASWISIAHVIKILLGCKGNPSRSDARGCVLSDEHGDTTTGGNRGNGPSAPKRLVRITGQFRVHASFPRPNPTPTRYWHIFKNIFSILKNCCVNRCKYRL